MQQQQDGGTCSEDTSSGRPDKVRGYSTVDGASCQGVPTHEDAADVPQNGTSVLGVAPVGTRDDLEVHFR